MRRRQQQNIDWVHNLVSEHLKRTFYGHPNIRINLPAIEEKIRAGELSSTQAALMLLDLFEQQNVVSLT